MITSRYWDIEEDKVLWEAMKEHGHLTKEQITLLVPRKTLNQCQNRVKQLRSQGGPTVRSRPHSWSAEDNQKFLKLVGDETNSWSSIAKDMGMELTPTACSNRYQRLKRLYPQLKKELKSNSYKTLAWKKRQLSKEQIEQYRQLLDSQTLIGKPEGHLSVEKVAKVQEDHKKGRTIAQICQDHNIATRNAAAWHCKKPSTTKRHHRWIVEDYFKLWYVIMIDELSIREASTRFDCSDSNCRSRIQIMQLNGLWLQEDGTLSKKRTVPKFPRKKAVSCERREEQLSDSDQPTDSDGDEHLLDDDTEQLDEEDDSLTQGDTQLHGNNQNKQDLRTRDCTRTDSCPPTHFKSKGDIRCIEKKADDSVESLSRPHEKGSLRNWNVFSNTEAHSATESLTIKHEPQEDNKVIGSQEVLNRIKKRALKEDVPEQKPEKFKRRKLSTVRNNPFTAKAAVDGQMAEVQPQELWLNASQAYSTYNCTSLTRVSITSLTNLYRTAQHW